MLERAKNSEARGGWGRLAWRLGFAVTLCGLAAGTGHAQDGGTVELKPNPAALMHDFEAAPNAEYELGRGDEIRIDFGGRPELNGTHVIGPDGRITLPLAGSIAVADKTREAAAAAISSALAAYYTAISVTIGVEKYTSNQVLLLGAVEHPGVQTFDKPPTLLAVVSRGGGGLRAGGGYAGGRGGGSGFSVQGDLQPVGMSVPDRVAIYRGSDKVLWVELKALLDSGSPLADLRLKRDDIVYVPSGSERYVSVLGAVQHPGALQLDGTTTLSKLLALSGGLLPQAGHYPDIRIIQPSTGTTRVISFKQVLQPGPLDLTLHSGDVVYVPESGFNRAAYVIEKISPLVTLFTASALIAK